MQIYVLPLYKLQDIAFEKRNPCELKENEPSQRIRKKQLSVPSFSDIKQEYQKNLIQGKIHNKKLKTKTY